MRRLLLLLLATCHVTQAEFRTYTARNGKTVEAEAISIRGTTLKFRTAQGTVHEVPIDTLSDADQAYLDEWKRKFPGVVLPDVAVVAIPHASNPVDGQRMLSYRFRASNGDARPLAGAAIHYQVHFTAASGRPVLSGMVEFEEIKPGSAAETLSAGIGMARSWQDREHQVAGVLVRLQQGEEVLASSRVEAAPRALEGVAWRQRIAETSLDLEQILDKAQRPKIHGRDLQVECRFETALPLGDGVVVVQGGSNNGYCLYLRDRRLFFAVRRNPGTEPTRVSVPLPALTDGSVVSATGSLEGGEIQLRVEGGASAREKILGRIDGTPLNPIVLGPNSGTAFSQHCPTRKLGGRVLALRVDVWREPGGGSTTGRTPQFEADLEQIRARRLNPRIADRDISLRCQLSNVRHPDGGVVITQGGDKYGYTLYLRDRQIWFVVRRSQEEAPARVSVPVPIRDDAVITASLSGDSILLAVKDGDSESAPIRGPIKGNPNQPLVLGPSQFPTWEHSPTNAFAGKIELLELRVYERGGDEAD